jgi:transposase
MMAFNRRTKVYAYAEPISLRRSFDGLYSLVHSVLMLDPMSGHVFVFVNRERTMCKCLYWDGSGLVILSKRLEIGKFHKINPAMKSIEMTEAEFALFFEGSDLRKRFIESPMEFKLPKKSETKKVEENPTSPLA